MDRAFLYLPHASSVPVEKKGNPRDGRLKLDAARPVAKKNLTSLRLMQPDMWVSTADLCSLASSPASHISLTVLSSFCLLFLQTDHAGRHTTRIRSSLYAGCSDFFSISSLSFYRPFIHERCAIIHSRRRRRFFIFRSLDPHNNILFDLCEIDATPTCLNLSVIQHEKCTRGTCISR